MALGIVKTLNNWLNMWPQGVNPGAGTQDPNTIGDGLNDNWKRIDLAVLTEHNSNGTHKSAVIDGANLKTTVADGSSIEQDSGTKKLKVKALGIATAMLADLAVTAAKIADATITAAKLSSGCVTTAKLDQTGGSEAVTTACIRTGAVTSAKVPREVSSYCIFNDARIAGLSAGDLAAGANEWLGTNATMQAKARFMYVKQTGDKYVTAYFYAKTPDGAKPWKVSLDVDATVVSTNGVQTTYDLSIAAYSVSVDVSSMVVGAVVDVVVSLGTTTGTAGVTMKHLTVMVHKA